MQRRDVLKSIVALAAATSPPPLLGLHSEMPVIDAHIHLFDPTRPGGVPWPEPTNTGLYRPALPSRYQTASKPHGIVGAIAVECSPWMIDNFWLQDVASAHPIMLGFIGNLLPASLDFVATLDRLHRSPLFLGIRYGNLWNRDLSAELHTPGFIVGLKQLADAGLVFETANPDAALIATVLRISDQVPGLRIVIDHLPNAQVPAGKQELANYEAHLREISERSNIFVKGSEIVRRISGRVSLDVGLYKSDLDRMWDLFGEDRIFFGSDWPNSDSLAPYHSIFEVARRYISTRSLSAQRKYFSKNSILVYKWKARTPAQAAVTR